ncbi:hypothetical protein ACQY1Q_17250 [Tenacibaculum sp. TC6]|uniref:hypothetical protein n=1 Tax=Tenacibaculum sp. TC6 TaxID=3423223 RepID=UPI003D361F75
MMQKVPSARKFIYLSICLMTISCSSNKLIISKDQTDILNEILYSSDYNVYYKTIISDLNKPLEDYITSAMEFQFCENESIKPNEISFLKKQKLEVINLYKLPLNIKEKITRKKKDIKTSHISIPILFRNNTMALYYNTQRDGGSFMLLQKKETKWEIICSSLIWIE